MNMDTALHRLLRVSWVALFVFVAMLAGAARASNEGDPKQPNTVKKDTAAAPKADPQKAARPTQTAASPQTQTQSADDDVPVMIQVDSNAKSTTIATPLGVQEGSARRHDTYTRISKQAKHAAQEARTSAEQSEQKQGEAENSANDKENETDKKPPQ